MLGSYRSLHVSTVVVSLLFAACDTPTDTVDIPAPDVASFELTVYPLLLRDCGFPECHGSTDRFFRVYGPGRLRLSESTATFAPATAAELAQSYARTRSMLAHEKSLAESWLLKKPLARAAGGAEHGGEDRYGRNVYESTRATGYVSLVQWAMSQQQKSAVMTVGQP